MKKILDGRRALVTGDSSGLGVDFADQLAARGADIILVARREERLREVAADLKARHGVDVVVIAMDLISRDAPARLYDDIKSRGLVVDILINNAGFGIYGPFLDADWERTEAMLDLNIMAPVHLTRLFAEDMVRRGWGRIMQVASIGAFQPSPKYAAYSASKSFIRSWGEAIDFELRDTGVSCTVVSPGVTKTEFLERSQDQKRTLYQNIFMMESPKVAAISVRAMLKQRMSIVPGFTNAFNAWLNRFFPRVLARWVAYLTMKSAR